MEIRSQHAAKVVKSDLFTLDGLSTNETDSPEMSIGFDGSMNQRGVVVEGLRGEQAGKLTEGGRNWGDVGQRKCCEDIFRIPTPQLGGEAIGDDAIFAGVDSGRIARIQFR